MHVEPLTEVPRNLVLRIEDERECLASGRSVGQCVVDNIDQSLFSFSVSLEGELVCLWGYAPTSLLGLGAQVWMLSTPAFAKHSRRMVRETRAQFQQLLTVYPSLFAGVQKSYAASVRWLEWLGFFPTLEYFEGDQPFLLMRATREGV